MYKLTDTFVFTLLIFAVFFISVAYTTLNNLFAVFYILYLMPMTHAPETDAINRLHFLAPAFGAAFSYHIRLEWKFLTLKMNIAT